MSPRWPLGVLRDGCRAFRNTLILQLGARVVVFPRSAPGGCVAHAALLVVDVALWMFTCFGGRSLTSCCSQFARRLQVTTAKERACVRRGNATGEASAWPIRNRHTAAAHSRRAYWPAAPRARAKWPRGVAPAAATWHGQSGGGSSQWCWLAMLGKAFFSSSPAPPVFVAAPACVQ